MSSKSVLPHLGRWGELDTWSLLLVPSRPPCGPVVCSSQPRLAGHQVSAVTALATVPLGPLSHQDEPRFVTSRVLCGLPASVPPSLQPFYSQGLRLHSSRQPLAAGHLLVFFLPLLPWFLLRFLRSVFRCPESACFPGSLYRMLLHHLLLPLPCFCLYHITTSEILNVSAVWLPPQK